MDIDESKRTKGLGWPCAHCTATGTEPCTGLDEGQRRTKCSKGCDDGFTKLIGYQEELPVKRGDRVRIPKGTLIKTCTKGVRLAGRTYVVTVNHTLCGMVDGEKVVNPSVCWPGPSGYWSKADINDVELVSP
jgi:hypothetical protein